MPRVPQILTKDGVAADQQAAFERVVEVFGEARGPFSILLHSPELAARMVELVAFNRENTVVEARLRCLAILAAVRERESDYVWAAQVGYARRVGIREQAIELLRAKGALAALEEDEREVVDYIRELTRTNKVDQAKFDALQRRHGTKWLVEATAAAGFYASLCSLANAFEVPALPDGDRFR